MERRTFLRAAVIGAGSAAFAGGLWQRAAHAAPAQNGAGPYGALQPADANGIRLPAGFTSRIVAPFLRITGQSGSEITGPAFSPAGNRFYFSSQRGTSGSSSGGITYEVTGPFRG